jgi:hypothetical protein
MQIPLHAITRADSNVRLQGLLTSVLVCTLRLCAGYTPDGLPYGNRQYYHCLLIVQDTYNVGDIGE